MCRMEPGIFEASSISVCPRGGKVPSNRLKGVSRHQNVPWQYPVRLQTQLDGPLVKAAAGIIAHELIKLSNNGPKTLAATMVPTRIKTMIDFLLIHLAQMHLN